MTVEDWVADFPIRIITAYGPQIGDSMERKQNVWETLEGEVKSAEIMVDGLIIHMNSNSNIRKSIIENDCNEQNQNGKLFDELIARNSSLTLIHSL